MSATRPRSRTLDEWEIDHFSRHPHELGLYLEVAVDEAMADREWGAFLAAARVAAAVLKRDLPKAIGDSPTEELFVADAARSVDEVNAVLRPLGFRWGLKPLPADEQEQAPPAAATG